MSKNDNKEYPIIPIEINSGKKIFFASDFHLFSPSHIESRTRERLIVQWLNEIKSEAAALFLVGDLFDFWFEYKHTIPKGATRLLGTIAAFTDAGIPVHIFTGNHDIWMFNYLEEELGVKIHRSQRIIHAAEKKIFIAHGDGLGPKDKKFKILKKFFTSKFCQWCFRLLHPDIGIKLALTWSKRSRANHSYEEEKMNKHLDTYAKRKLEQKHYDYFIFGHRHIPMEVILTKNSKYINLGDWIFSYTYAEFDGSTIKLKQYEV